MDIINRINVLNPLNPLPIVDYIIVICNSDCAAIINMYVYCKRVLIHWRSEKYIKYKKVHNARARARDMTRSGRSRVIKILLIYSFNRRYFRFYSDSTEYVPLPGGCGIFCMRRRCNLRVDSSPFRDDNACVQARNNSRTLNNALPGDN